MSSPTKRRSILRSSSKSKTAISQPTEEFEATGDAEQEKNHEENNNVPATPEVARIPESGSSVKRSRRRKTAVLPVGKTRDKNSTALVVAERRLEDEIDALGARKALLPASAPEDGKPRMRSFCTSYPKPKRTRKKKEENTTAQNAPEPEPEAAAAAAAVQKPHAGPVVQIVNGEIVLQESSMVFQGSGAQASAGEQAMIVVEEDTEMAAVGASYSSFATGRRARAHVHHWKVDETQLFYEALRQVGLDFATMEAYFDNVPNVRKRLRRQLKKKYQAELIKNPHLIEKALRPSGRVDIDLSVFQLTEEKVNEIHEEDKKKEAEKAAETEKTAAAAEEDAEIVTEEDGTTSSKPAAEPEFSWPDEEETAVDDPILFEEEEHAQDTEEAPKLSLVHGVALARSTTKKPNFRSRKLRRKS